MNISFKLKGSVFTLSVLELLDASLPKLDEDLANKVRLAPKFFNHTPVVIDIKNLQSGDIDFIALRDLLTRHHLVPLGIRGANERHTKAIQAASLAILTDHGELKNHAITAKEGVRLIKTPVRSGQQIYAQGDLIVASSVSRGAEVLAEGNIHIYGALRGRALAGVNGDKEARIFCQQLDAELVAIAGEFKLFNEQDVPIKTPSQIVLDEHEKVVVMPISI